MTTTLRVAVRKFTPFETAIARQFDDFVRTTGEDVRLDIVPMELNHMREALFDRRELAGGDWDIAFLSTDWIAQAQHERLVDNLLPFMQQEPLPGFPDAWSPSLLRLQSFNDGIWGLPYHDGPECLIYRKDCLSEAGIDVPRTWDDFVAAAQALHRPEKDFSGTAMALFPDGHNGFYDFCIHVWTRGGEPFNTAARPNLQTAAARAALDFIRGAANDRTMTPANQRELDSVKAGLLFCEGRVAMMVNWFGFAALGETMTDSKVKGRVGVAAIPAEPGHANLSLNVFWLLTIASGSAHKNLAWRFLRHCASAAMDRLTTTEGAIGTRRSTWLDPEINSRIPYYHQLDALHAVARDMPRHPKLAEISHVIDAMIAQAITTPVPSDVLLAGAQRSIEEIVE
jgi:multiple sugar transport system substrate-binding protein